VIEKTLENIRSPYNLKSFCLQEKYFSSGRRPPLLAPQLTPPPLEPENKFRLEMTLLTGYLEQAAQHNGCKYMYTGLAPEIRKVDIRLPGKGRLAV